MQHRITLSCALAVALLVGVYVLYQHPPGQESGGVTSFYPQCQLYKVTGLYCPGCGGTRCVSALLHLQPGEAMRKNALVFFALPFLGVWTAKSWWRWVTGKPKREVRAPRNWVVVTVVAGLLLFGVLRNLPWEPFSLLVPR